MLTGCTDLRTRISPDILAADAGETCRFAAHTAQLEKPLSAEAALPALMPEALSEAAGAEISCGHVSLLALSGEQACEMLETAFRARWIPPDSAVLLVPDGACALLDSGVPESSDIQTAVKDGLLPPRTAGTVLGDLREGSGISAAHGWNGTGLTAMLFAGNMPPAALSPDACRGLALWCGRWEHFRFAEGGTAYTLRYCTPAVSVSLADEKLRLDIRASFAVQPDDQTGRDVIKRMLLSAVTETAWQGADILYLRERAAREGICTTQEAWRSLLCGAEICFRGGGSG